MQSETRNISDLIFDMQILSLGKWVEWCKWVRAHKRDVQRNLDNQRYKQVLIYLVLPASENSFYRFDRLCCEMHYLNIWLYYIIWTYIEAADHIFPARVIFLKAKYILSARLFLFLGNQGIWGLQSFISFAPRVNLFIPLSFCLPSWGGGDMKDVWDLGIRHMNSFM